MRQLPLLKMGTKILTIIAVMWMAAFAAAQSVPSASSGINASDTYCIFDLTLTNQGTLTLSQPVLDPATNTSTSTVPMNAAPTHLHVEAGYDVNDRLVLNVVFTDPQVDTTTTSMDPVGRMRITNGRMVLYDWSGNPIPMSLPAFMPMPKTPQAFFGLAAGPSVLNGMVVANPWSFASSIGATASPSSSSLGGQPAVAASASVTISGTEHSKTITIIPPRCPRGVICDQTPETSTIYDTGKVYITINGHEYDYFFGQNDTSATIAQQLVSTIQNDSTRVVNASVPAGGTQISLTAVTAGAAGNNITIASGATYDSADFSSVGPSFSSGPASGALAGGVNAVPGTPVTNMQFTASATGNPGGTATWSYQNTGTTWILTRVDGAPAATASTQSTHSSQLANMVWNTSSAGEARRAARASLTTPEPSSSNLTLPSPTLPLAPTLTPNLVQIPGTSGPNVVMQHGIQSDHHAWDLMGLALRNSYNFTTDTRPDINWQDRLSNQATSLIGMLAQANTLHNIMIGHSEGGILLRDVAQQRPDLASGVITLESPNNGAKVANLSPLELAAIIEPFALLAADTFGCQPGEPDFFCRILFLVATDGSPIFAYSIDPSFPSKQDLKPNSAYLNTLNSHAESFVRVGIEAHSQRRWALYRLLGDYLCVEKEHIPAPCGRDVAKAAQSAFHGLIACEITALIFGDYERAFECAVLVFELVGLDAVWNFVTAGTDATDGFISAGGQNYHNSTINYIINDADSHVGALVSDKVLAALKTALNNQFLVPHVGCTLTASPTAISLPSVGGGGTINISTGPGCSSTTFSSDNWVKITNPSGAGTRTVSFVADPNLSPFARSATITIEGATVTVTEDAATGSVFPALALSHVIGQADGDGWSANPVQNTTQNWLSYGPYTTDVPVGNNVAVFKLMIDSNQGANTNVVAIDVNDGTIQQRLALRFITRQMFLGSGEYQFFSLPFNLPAGSAGHQVEFRVFWYDVAFIKEQAVGFASATGSPLDLRWNAQSTELSHLIGGPDGDGWSAGVGAGQSYLSYGPYTTLVPAGLNLAVFRLMIDNNSADNNTMLTLDVNDATAHKQLGQRNITRQEFNAPNEYQYFSIPFVLDGGSQGHQLEFRVYRYDLAYIKEQGVTFVNLADSNSPLQYIANDPALLHSVGRLDGTAWSADLAHGDQPNWFQYGPRATNVPVGNNIAVFRFLIDNNTQDNANIVYLDVYDHTADVVLTTRFLARSDFHAANTYENFTVPFRIDPTSLGHQIELRAWYYAISTLKEQSVGWVQQH